MKKTLHFSTFLLLSWCLLVAGLQQARASHAQAGELTYRYMSTAPNGDQTYTVTVNFFRDCSGIPAPGNFLLTAQNSCGGTSRTVTLNPVGQPVIGSPYCTSVQALAVCPLTGSAPSNAPPNYAIYTYENTIVLPPAAEWILSVEENARPSVANLAFGGTLRLEARLNSRITPVGGGAPVNITNSSPVFSTTNLPVPFVYVNQEATLSFAATDAYPTNGIADSLVYTLDSPLNGCNTYEIYATYPSSGCRDAVDPRCPSRLLRCVGITGNLYSATLPIPVANDTLRPTPCSTTMIGSGTIRPQFVFTPLQASFRFTPNRFLNTPSAAGDNKYAVVGKVTEYRKINGRYYLVGSVRRDFLVIVISGAGNSVPANPTGTAGPPRSGVVLNITRDTTDLEIKTCNYSRVRFNFTDPDNTGATPPSPLQNLTVFYPADINTNLLQSGDIGTFVLSRNGTPNPSATFYFQPTSALAGTTILIPLRIEDDGCPAKGIQYRTVRIRVVNFRGAEAAAAVQAPGLGGSTVTAPAICPGGVLTINGSVLRPDSVRSAASGLVGLQTYSYQWTALNGTAATNGLPTATNTANISVRPTVTTRYRLRIEPLQGFGVGACGDTTSVLVRVVPEPVATATASLPKVCAGAPVQLRGTVVRPAGSGSNLTDTYTYRWTGPSVPATATTQNLTVNPTTLGVNTYVLTANGASPYGCDATTTVSVEVVPPPAVRLTTSTVYICAGSTASLQASATAPANFTDAYTYRFDAANGLAAADLTKPNPTVSPTVTTRYRVTASGNPVTGCADTASVVVRVLPGVVANFTTRDSVGLNGQRTSRPPVVFTFTNTSATTGAVAGAVTSYVWEYQRIRDITGAAVSGEPLTVFGGNTATPAPLTLGLSGFYRVRLTTQVSIGSGATAVACAASVKERTILVPDLQVPNIITPNGDKLNDVFKVSTANTLSKLEIYNRWGRKVADFANYANNWGGDDQPAGVYYYLLTDRNGAQTKGWIEVVR